MVETKKGTFNCTQIFSVNDGNIRQCNFTVDDVNWPLTKKGLPATSTRYLNISIEKLPDWLSAITLHHRETTRKNKTMFYGEVSIPRSGHGKGKIQLTKDGEHFDVVYGREHIYKTPKRTG